MCEWMTTKYIYYSFLSEAILKILLGVLDISLENIMQETEHDYLEHY